VGFGNASTRFSLQFLGTGKAVFHSILAQIFPDVKARRAYNIHVDGESSGTTQMEHQGSAALKDEGTACNFQGFQQRESAYGFLQKGSVSDVGIFGA